MKPQNLTLYATGDRDRWRTIIKNRHGRVIFVEVSIRDGTCKITDHCYVDRLRSGKYYAVPKKFVTMECAVSSLLSIIASELDRTYYGINYSRTHSDLSNKEFISAKLSEMQRTYRFLIFVAEGEPVNHTFPVLKTRFKNKLHRSIYLELHTCDVKTTITDCHYFDREYNSPVKAVPPTLSCISFDYSRSSILRLVNEELVCDFTDMLIVSDGSIDISKPMPFCGHIH